jgi:AcrR family transcriptional regulator
MAQGRGKRARIGRDQIIQTAMTISDAEGDLDAITVRSIASRLGVGTMTLYGYFRSKDEILDAMADHVMGTMRLPRAEVGTPREALRDVGYAFRELMTSHPSAARLLSSRSTNSLMALQSGMEAALRRLVDSGLSPEVAIRCYGFLLQYAMGFAAYQSPRPYGAEGGTEGAELRRQRQHFYAGLPADEFPQVVSMAELIVTLPTGDQFEWGLERFIDSLDAGA